VVAHAKRFKEVGMIFPNKYQKLGFSKYVATIAQQLHFVPRIPFHPFHPFQIQCFLPWLIPHKQSHGQTQLLTLLGPGTSSPRCGYDTVELPELNTCQNQQSPKELWVKSTMTNMVLVI
jgi:hypothetical protein